MPATMGYVNTMRRLLADAGGLLDSSEVDEKARQDLAEKFETMLDLVSMQGHALHRPQVDAMAPMVDT
jgi:hypothetical protein